MPTLMLNRLNALMAPAVMLQASTALNEPPAAISRAMDAVLPALLRGLSLGIHQPKCRNALFALATHDRNDVRLLANAGDVFSGPTEGTLGDRMLRVLFGTHIDAVAGPIATYAGIDPSSAESLMSATARLVLADLGQRLQTDAHRTPAALSALVRDAVPSSTAWWTTDAIDAGSFTATPRPYIPDTPYLPDTMTDRTENTIRRFPGTTMSGIPSGIPASIQSRAADAAANIRRVGTLNIPRMPGLQREPTDGATGRGYWKWIWLPILAILGALLIPGNFSGFRSWWTGTSVQSPTLQSTLPRVPRASRLSLDFQPNSVEGRAVRYIESPQPLSSADWFELDRIFFQTGSNTLSAASTDQIAALASILDAFPTLRLKIGGYTDNVGEPSANLRLSDARANAVMRELVRLGVAPERLTAEGYGELHPVADNGTTEGRARNRRIAFRVVQR